MERFMRENTTYLSLHQYALNCLTYGQQYLEQNGMAASSGVLKDWLATQDLLAEFEFNSSLLSTSRELWNKAHTPDTKVQAASRIRESAVHCTDPVLQSELLRILE
jgi:hypothetical protein